MLTQEELQKKIDAIMASEELPNVSSFVVCCVPRLTWTIAESTSCSDIESEIAYEI